MLLITEAKVHADIERHETVKVTKQCHFAAFTLGDEERDVSTAAKLWQHEIHCSYASIQPPRTISAAVIAARRIVRILLRPDKTGDPCLHQLGAEPF